MARRKMTSQKASVWLHDKKGNRTVQVLAQDQTNAGEVNCLLDAENKALRTIGNAAELQIFEAFGDDPPSAVIVNAISRAIGALAAKAHAMGQTLNHNAQRAKASFEFSGTPDQVLAQDAAIHEAVEKLRDALGKDKACRKVANMKDAGKAVWRSTRKNQYGVFRALAFEGVKRAHQRHALRITKGEVVKPLAMLQDSSFVPMKVLCSGLDLVVKKLPAKKPRRVVKKTPK